MYFEGCLSILGRVPEHVLDAFEAELSKFESLWKVRSLNVMKEASVLKAKSPTVIDELDSESRAALWEMMQPVLKHVNLQNESVVYADVSALPPKGQINLHVDSVLMHAMARRIHIPVRTNKLCKMGFVSSTGAFEIFHMARGQIYEVNNILPHAVKNNGTESRYHILLDVISNELQPLIASREVQYTMAPITNFILSPITSAKMHHALSVKSRS